MADPMTPCRAAGQVAQLMTAEPITVLPETPTREVWVTMSERRFRHMPVADSEGLLVGIISRRDLMVALYTDGSLDDSKGTMPISELMHPEVDTVRAECCAGEAARHMLRSKRSCLPVVEKDGQIVGILTEADFLRIYMRTSPACTCGGMTHSEPA